MEKIPILICVDSEPNARSVDPTRKSDWTGFEQTFKFFRELRPRLQSASRAPVHFTWFMRMDPQVEYVYGDAGWVVRRYQSILDQLQSDGDDIGLHAHPWQWSDQAKTWIANFGEQAWVNHCLELSFKTFQATMGRPCTLFSFGDHWMNEATLDLLERLGAEFDISTQPGLTISGVSEPYSGVWRDYAELPRIPYRPFKRDFTRSSTDEMRQIWEIPLSTGSTDWAHTTFDPSGVSFGSTDGSTPWALEGYHDGTDEKWVIGWVWDANQPNSALNVEILDGDQLVDTITANSFRRDLLEAGKGDGRHSFRYRIPDCLRDGKSHSIRVKVAGSDFDLAGTTQDLPIVESPTYDRIDMAMYLNHEPFLFGKVVDRLLFESDRPQLSLITRSDIGIKPIEKFYVQKNFEHILNHPLADRFVFERVPEFVERVTGQAIRKAAVA